MKLLEKFGKVKQFDFLFHKSGPLEGQPRGYCFVNFSTREVHSKVIFCIFNITLHFMEYIFFLVTVCIYVKVQTHMHKVQSINVFVIFRKSNMVYVSLILSF